MRLNKFIAQNSSLSRRRADELIKAGKVSVNGSPAIIGQRVSSDDTVTINGKALGTSQKLYLMLNKPVGYVCSKRSQGAPTVYSLLPVKYAALKTVGRLDKDSSGLILLSNDGNFAHCQTHPSFKKQKVYQVKLDRQLSQSDRRQIESGVELPDGISRLSLADIGPDRWQVTMHEGRNRQIRRTFEALGYKVVELHRTEFGDFNLNNLPTGQFKEVNIARP